MTVVKSLFSSREHEVLVASWHVKCFENFFPKISLKILRSS